VYEWGSHLIMGVSLSVVVLLGVVLGGVCTKAADGSSEGY